MHLRVPASSDALSQSRANASARSRRLLLRLTSNAATYIILIVLGIAFLMPFLFMVSTAFKPASQLFQLPFTFIPNPPRPQNFTDAMAQIPFWRFTLNTIIITGTTLVGETITSAVVAYGFARLRFVGRDVWFIVVLATMMLPQQVTLIPLFILFKQIGWLDTFLPLIVPAILGGAPFYIFLLRQFFLTIPSDLEDAARIDGASSLGILIRIFMPLSKAAVASVVIFSFMFHWNDFFTPLIFLSSTNNKTLALGIALFQGQFQDSWNAMMAVSTLVLLPCVVIFLVAQRYFVEGITMTGMKG